MYKLIVESGFESGQIRKKNKPMRLKDMQYKKSILQNFRLLDAKY